MDSLSISPKNHKHYYLDWTLCKKAVFKGS